MGVRHDLFFFYFHVFCFCDIGFYACQVGFRIIITLNATIIEFSAFDGARNGCNSLGDRVFRRGMPSFYF